MTLNQRKMLVDTPVYRAFYKILWDTILKREFNDKMPDGLRKRYARGLWIRVKNKKKIGDKFIYGSISDPKYFYRRYSALDGKTTSKGDIDDCCYCLGLSYLEETPIEISEIASPYKTALALQASFKEKYTKEIEWEINHPNEEDNGEPIPEKSDIQCVEATVTAFHEKVGSGDYQGAWDLLHPSFKQRVWGEDFQRFALGYINSHGVRNIHVFQTTRTASANMDCKIYFEQEVSTASSPELDFLRSGTVANIDTVCAIVKQFRQEMKQIDAVAFDRMELFRLFDAGVSEYIWYTSRITPQAIHRVLPVSKTIPIGRLYLCTCILMNGQWLISRIRKIETASVR